MGIAEIVFFVVAVLAVVSALGVILHPHPVYSALFLVVALFQIAVLFILLDAQMVAFLQVIVYAGAIMVLFLFVIMLLNLEREPEPPPAAWRLLMLCVGGALGLELAWFFLRRAPLPAVHGTIDKSYRSGGGAFPPPFPPPRAGGREHPRPPLPPPLRGGGSP